MRLIILLWICIQFLTTSHGSPVRVVVADAVPAKLADVLSPVEPGDVRLDGWLGARVDRNIAARLKVVDLAPLLAGYQHRPGEHPWIGEHIGKWIDAATLAWAYSGDAELRSKLDGAVRDLIATQEPDGYLGTYAPAQRFSLAQGADWDVWSHKYSLIGLLTYHRYTGDEAALQAARRAADLLLSIFPSQKSILAAGTHRGMAATSVLEPMVALYQRTADVKYLHFAHSIVAAYDEPGGPAILKSLLAGVPVNQTANGKAYEMLSNLKGLVDLAAVEGDRQILKAVDGAWGDIVANRLYLTGTTSAHEVFGEDHELPNGMDAHVGETCVTTTWIQLNRRLLLLTGESRYADEIERSLYNHLAAAQNPRGDDWCYYTALLGQKKYDAGITCCHSSGPRALSLAPTTAYFTTSSTVYVNTFETSRASLPIHGGEVGIEQRSRFPHAGETELVLHLKEPARFALRIRAPQWALPLTIADGSGTHEGWIELGEREWKEGDRVPLRFQVAPRVIVGSGSNFGRAALTWGPFVLAMDEAENDEIAWVEESLRVVPDAPYEVTLSANGRLQIKTDLIAALDEKPRHLTLVPFADAGSSGSSFRVWLRAPERR